jgi:hypothetical protein
VFLFKPSTDGTGTQANLLCNVSHCQALLLQFYDVVIPLEAAFTASMLHVLDERGSIGLPRSNWEGSSF